MLPGSGTLPTEPWGTEAKRSVPPANKHFTEAVTEEAYLGEKAGAVDGADEVFKDAEAFGDRRVVE